MGVDFRWTSGGAECTSPEDAFSELVSPPPAAPRPRWRLRWRTWLLLLLPFVALGGFIYWRVREGEAAARADLQRVVEREVALLAAGGSTDEFLALLAPTPGYWQDYHRANYWRESAWFAERAAAEVRVENVRLQPGGATATVTLRDGEQVYRGTWYYALVDGEWRHAAPPAEVLSEKHTAEAGRVTVTAQGLSEAEAASLAAELDALCTDLMQRYGLTPESIVGTPVEGTSEPITSLRIEVEVSPSRESGVIARVGSSARLELLAPSPQLGLELLPPAVQSASLRRTLRLGLASQLLYSAGSGLHCTQALALRHAEAWDPAWADTVHRAVADGTWRRYLDLWSPDTLEEDSWWQEVFGRYEGASEAALMQTWYEWYCGIGYALGDFLYSNYPSDQLAALLQAGRSDPPSPWPAVESELGLTREELEARWGAFLQEEFGDGRSE